MHPINSRNFGIHGLAVQYYNGTSVVPGYIVRQIGTKRFMVTDGSHPATVQLAQTLAIATSLSTTANHGFCSILVTPSSGTNANFTAHFGINTVVVAYGGTGYVVGDLLHPTGVNGATLTVTSIGPYGVTGVSLTNAGSTTSLPGNPVPVTGGTGSGCTLNLTFLLVAVTASGGNGYAVGETLYFSGMTAVSMPTVQIAAVSGGAPTTLTVTPGAGITVAGSLPGTPGAQHVINLEEFVAWTAEGNKMHWTLGIAVNGSAYIATFS